MPRTTRWFPQVRAIVGAVVLAAALAMLPPASASAETIRIPSIGVQAPVVPGNLGGSIHKVYGSVPQLGSSVLIGHSYIRGGRGQGGVFDRLPQVRPGHRIFVGRREFVATKTVKVSVPQYRKMLPRLNSVRGERRVALVTCTNRNDSTGVYTKRLIVFTRLVKK